MNYGRIYAIQYLSPGFPSSARSLLAKSIVRFCWFAFISFFLDRTVLNKCEPADAQKSGRVAGFGCITSACGSNRHAGIDMGHFR